MTHEITPARIRELSMYEGHISVEDTEDPEVVALTVTIPMDPGTASDVYARLGTLE
jgi:hypothetical protein